MQGKAGKEGFLYDRLRANEENGNTGGIQGRDEVEKRKERFPSESGNMDIWVLKTNQRPRARSL